MNTADEKLVSQTLAGDRDAFGVLVHKYQEMVYTYAFHKVRNEADAQDIMQEIFLQAYRRLYQLRQPHLFRSWLYTIMSNECKRWLELVTKKRRQEVALEQATDEALQIEPAHAVPVEGWQVNLEQAISALPDESRIAVSMFYMGDCSLKEISEFLGVSVNTVKSKLRRARQQLGDALSEHYGRLLKSHKLRGGFLMQIMERIHNVPAPALGFAWSSATVGKTVFSLIVALCILIGLVGVRNELPIELSANQIGLTPSVTNRLPIEVEFLDPVLYPTRPSVMGIPEPAGKRPLVDSSHASTERGHNSTNGAPMPHGRGVETPHARSSAAMTEKGVEKLTYSGRVVNDDGEPVPDAEVLYSVNSNPPISVTRTATDGTFRFELVHPVPNEQNLVDIVAAHPQHASGWQNLPAQSTADVEIQLEKSAIISGRIMNTAGNPVQNVEVQIKSFFSNGPLTITFENYSILDLMPIPPVETDVNGSFIFRRLPQGRTANLYVHGRGYARKRQDSVPTGTKGLELRLLPEARIEGHFSYEETGAPVSSATVSVEGIYPTEGHERTGVDENGNYVVQNLASGIYNVYLQGGPEGWTAASNAIIKVDEGQTVSDVDLILVRIGFVTGQVTDRDTDEPIADHYIRFHDAARPDAQVRGHNARTDESGTYRFHAAPGPGFVIVTAPHGYQDVGHIRQDVKVVEAETVVVDFQFSKGTSLICRILTETGEPIAGARVTDPSGLHNEYGTSNERGELTIRGLRPGHRIALAAEKSDLKLRGSAEVEIQPGASVEIRMKPYEFVKVSGRVVNRKGEPISSVNIERMRWDPERHAGIRSTVAVTDGEGRFREVGLIVGDQYVISAKAHGYWKTETVEFTATEGMSQIDEFVLRPAIGQFFIKGRVTDTTGKPVRSARVYTIHKSQEWYTRTDENGDYQFDDLLMNVILSLEVYHPDYARHKFEILRTNRRHNLVLVKADGYIAGRVVDADGNPIQRATVMIDPQEDPISGILYPAVDTNVQGEFELEYIKDPTVSIYVSADRDYKIFEGIAVNQRDLVLTLTPPAEPRPEPTPEQQERSKAQQVYVQDAEERFKTLVNQPAPALAVGEWLSGPPVSVRDLKGKAIALYFWDDMTLSDRIQSARLLNLLHEVYGEKGLVCAAICSADSEIETVKRHIAEYSLAYSVGLDSPTDVVGAEGETFNRYAFGWPAASFTLINAAGEITRRVWDSELEEQIQILLAD